MPKSRPRSDFARPVPTAMPPSPAILPQRGEDLGWLAQLMASGQLPFPGDVPLDQQHELVVRISMIRRSLFQNFVARQLALALRDDRDPVRNLT